MKKYSLLIVLGHMGLLAFSQTSYQAGSQELAAARARSQGSFQLCKTCDPGLMPTVRVLSYSVNGNSGYLVSGCVPKSDVELYSTATGGQVLAKKIADEKGQSNFMLAANQKPAFALNHNRRNGNGVSGNAQLFAIGSKELVLNSLKLSTSGNEVRVSWNAFAQPDKWTFVVQRSRDNNQFEDVQTLAPRSATTLSTYAVAQASPTEVPLMYYRVEARSSNGFSVAMPSEMLKFAQPSFFQVQPTVFSGSVQLVVAPDKVPSSYTVTDISGRNKLYSGTITSVRQTLNLKLNPGMYIVSLTDKKGISSSQVIIKN